MPHLADTNCAFQSVTEYDIKDRCEHEICGAEEKATNGGSDEYVEQAFGIGNNHSKGGWRKQRVRKG